MTAMKNRLVALVAALGLAVAGAAPAAAMTDKERNALTIILGAAALGLILKESGKKDSHVPRRDDDWRRHDGRWNSYRTIPAQCALPVRTARGQRTVIMERCVKGFGIQRDLPRACAFNVRFGREIRRVYGVSCLQNSGYRIARYR